MSLDTIVWISVTLFMVHEFEEIVFIHPWLVRHRDDPRAQRQVFWSWRNNSTSTIAAMIFEEYTIFTCVAFVATLAEQPALFAGLLIPYALHLIGHIAEAIGLRMRTPSVLTAAVTLPWFLYAAVDLTVRSPTPVMVAVWAAVFAGVIAANFSFIYRFKPLVEQRISGEVKSPHDL